MRNISDLTTEELSILITVLAGFFLAVFFAFKFSNYIVPIQRFLEKKYGVKIIKGMDLMGYAPDGGIINTLKIKGEVSRSRKRWIAFLFDFYTLGLVFLPIVIWILLVAVFYDELKFLKEVGF